MDAHQIAQRSKVAAHLVKMLVDRRMEASFAPTAAQARDEVVAMVPAGATVYRGGSMSLVEMGLWEAMRRRADVTIIDPYDPPGRPLEETLEQRRRGLAADVMVASANAITLDGMIVNLDGMGNRVAGICFGPRKVILVVGLNKVTADLEEAMRRVKHKAAPTNSIRFGLGNPCEADGLCHDCRGPKRICNMWSIIEGHMLKDRIHVKLVGEDLGY